LKLRTGERKGKRYYNKPSKKGRKGEQKEGGSKKQGGPNMFLKGGGEEIHSIETILWKKKWGMQSRGHFPEKRKYKYKRETRAWSCLGRGRVGGDH